MGSTPCTIHSDRRSSLPPAPNLQVLHIVMEYASHGTLADRVRALQGAPVPEALVLSL